MSNDEPSEASPEATPAETPATRISSYLEERGIAHELIEHEPAMTARAEAREAGADPSETAKGVLLHAGDGYLLAVIPASHHLDLAKVRDLAEDPEVRLGTEAEMETVAPDLEIGALPPIGPDLPAPELLDRRLLDHDRILCNSGDHRHSVRLNPRDLVDVVEPKLGDICQD